MRSRAVGQDYPSSISSVTSCERLTPPTVRTILAGSFSLPLRRPAATASRTAFSISRCEVMPTFLRNPRRLLLKVSSFMVGSFFGRPGEQRYGLYGVLTIVSLRFFCARSTLAAALPRWTSRFLRQATYSEEPTATLL